MSFNAKDATFASAADMVDADAPAVTEASAKTSGGSDDPYFE